ncbi:MAG: ATP-binding cassette domain-containing protein, partial [Acidobacteria bacterium]|nr:ATP-binding cassette domain-containing protein [Acidobacteriota bacterium]
EDLSFTVTRGEVFVLLGESGCGKTTTLKIINRLIERTVGQIFVEGRDTRQWDVIELRRQIGYVLQEAGLFPHLTVRENIGIVPLLKGWNDEQSFERVNDLMKLVDLPPTRFAERFPHELSGGQRQRVGVARALAADPPIVVLDEPFGALDAITRTNLQKEFAKLVRELGKTAVFVTHDLKEAMWLGSRILLMAKGRIAFLDTPEKFASSDLPLAQAYLETIAVRE